MAKRVVGGELVLEFVDKNSVIKGVYYQPLENVFEIHDRSGKVVVSDNFKLVHMLVVLGIKKVIYCNPKYYKVLIAISYTAFKRGNLTYLPVYVKINNSNYSKTCLGEDERASVQKYLDNFSNGYFLKRFGIGDYKICRDKPRKVMAVSAYFKKNARYIPRMSELLRNGWSPESVRSLAFVLDRHGVNYHL